MKRTHRIVLIVVGLMSVVSSGCALLLIGTGAAAGAGTMAYLQGELKATREVTVEKATKAVELALKDLQFPITDRSKEAGRDKIVSRASGDKKVEITLKAITGANTEIRIRVGVFGDESISRLVLQKIDKHL